MPLATIPLVADIAGGSIGSTTSPLNSGSADYLPISEVCRDAALNHPTDNCWFSPAGYWGSGGLQPLVL